jgi:hypothetical protein
VPPWVGGAIDLMDRRSRSERAQERLRQLSCALSERHDLELDGCTFPRAFALGWNPAALQADAFTLHRTNFPDEPVFRVILRVP